ncbi:GDSL esterase/lipase At2g30310-like [Mercurialis annua]|uniref:GDSL esterase/lipase At2g30310-like n=1 Tax=Mercurialis annua TaxID=3986 RepID=UPI00216072C8|nr:GDSL esterase/lipase At2g30310-like [Mercurialis annua]
MAQITFFFLITMIFTSFYTIKAANPKFPAILVFGDSSVDTGNNNYISTLLKANYLPYGEDFPGKIPTGRFSNGKLVPDLIASALGIKELVPPFLNSDLSDNEIITGVNFASAGSGFDNLTTRVTRAIPVLQQIDYFKTYITRLNTIVGEEKAKGIINGALVLISVGTNDMLINFYDIPTRRLQYGVNGYHDFLLGIFQVFIKDLYDLGCRKFVVAGLSPLGCVPLQLLKINRNFNEKCSEDQNIDSKTYNVKLQNLLSEMQSSLSGSNILYNNVYDPLLDMISNPQQYGFVETKSGCCSNGPLKSTTFICNPLGPTCKNHSQYLFWDIIHPSLAVYQRFAQNMLDNIIPKL